MITIKALITQDSQGGYRVELLYPIHPENSALALHLGQTHSEEALQLASALYKQTSAFTQAKVAANCGGYYTVQFFDITKKQIAGKVGLFSEGNIALNSMSSTTPDHVREFLVEIYEAICKMANTTPCKLHLHWATPATQYKEASNPFIHSDHALGATLDTILV